MSCCSTATSKNIRKLCPECSESCLGVPLQTLIHQVQFPQNQTLEDDDYSFCSNHLCDTVYFSSSNIIPKKKIRDFKENMLCYCFDISKDLYQSALESQTSQPIKTFVIQQTKLKTCACEVKNPSGRCCLANFKHMEKDHDHK